MEGLIDYNSPFQFGDDMLREQTKGLNQIDETDSGGMSVGGGAGSGRGRQLGPPGVPNAPGGGGPSGPAQFIRWVYNRGGSRYGFILDNNNRVVQIEAIGMQNNKVRTRRGIGFGATFKDVMSKYQAPEGYQINGDAIIMRYLVRDKVAFRLNRLGLDKPHVVTAIVVAAGKT